MIVIKKLITRYCLSLSYVVVLVIYMTLVNKILAENLFMEVRISHLLHLHAGSVCTMEHSIN